MSNNLDLRKLNLRTEEDVQEFLEVIVRLAPQLVSFLKAQKLKRVSLQNQIQHLKDNPVQAPTTEVIDQDASVLQRMGGKHKAPAKSAEQSRLEQMKAAGAAPAAKPANKPVETVDELPPAPVAPGEIGHLNVPEVGGHAPDAKKQEAEQPLAPADGGTVDSDQAASSEEAAAEAGGSKSERASDDGVQPEDTSEPDAPEVAPDAPVSGPTEEDKVPVGTRVAKKTKGKLGDSKK